MRRGRGWWIASVGSEEDRPVERRAVLARAGTFDDDITGRNCDSLHPVPVFSWRAELSCPGGMAA